MSMTIEQTNYRIDLLIKRVEYLEQLMEIKQAQVKITDPMHKNTLIPAQDASKAPQIKEYNDDDRVVFSQGDRLLSEFVDLFELCREHLNRNSFTMYRMGSKIKVIPFVVRPKGACEYMFKVPNDASGWAFLVFARKMLFNGRKMRVRGANIDHSKLREGERSSQFWMHVPQRLAKNLRVYIKY